MALLPEQIIVLSQRLGTNKPCVALRDEISKPSIETRKIYNRIAYHDVIMTQLSYVDHL